MSRNFVTTGRRPHPIHLILKALASRRSSFPLRYFSKRFDSHYFIRHNCCRRFPNNGNLRKVSQMNLDIGATGAQALSKAEPESRESTLTGPHFAEPQCGSRASTPALISLRTANGKIICLDRDILGNWLLIAPEDAGNGSWRMSAQGTFGHNARIPESGPERYQSALPTWHLDTPGLRAHLSTPPLG